MPKFLQTTYVTLSLPYLFFRFKTGVTLRFPRLEAVRNDKMWYECLDLNELARLKSVSTVVELV